MTIRLSLYHDVLCAMCQVAASRVRRLEDEFGDLLSVELRPYPMRLEEASPTRLELRKKVRQVCCAAREVEGEGLSAELWRGLDPPTTSLPPLVAAEAARLQGRAAQRSLLDALRDAAFQGALNVTRRDVIFELAASAGLQMDEFAAAFDAPATLRAVEDSRREATRLGVRVVPALVIGGEWLVSGVREIHEYREVLLRWLQRRGSAALRVLH
jgi:predicted DsbA family dithiol-disulfide isomerase